MTKPQAKPAAARPATAAPQPAATDVTAKAPAKVIPLIPGREAAKFTEQFGHKPKYALTEKAYIGDILYDPESPVHPVTKRPRAEDAETGERAPLVIEFEGIPGPHMTPTNDAARAMVQAHPKAHAASINPVESLTTVGPGATVLQPAR